MNIRYRVELCPAERDHLIGMLSAGKRAARRLKRAQILLAADAGAGDEEIARTIGVGGSTVYRTKRQFVEVGLEAALARMEDVLDLYSEAPDPKRPVVCFDESPTQLIGEVRSPTPARPGQLERFDCEYRRNGTANLFVFLDAHNSWRKVKVTDRRAAEDFALCMRELSDVHFPEAEKNPRRAGQSLHPLRERPLPDFPRARGAAHPAPAGVPLHAQARQLAQHGRNRNRCPTRPMPRPTHRQPRSPRLRNRPLGAPAKPKRRPHQMDVHHR